ncbi:MAG: hypothetical protein GY810_27080 [Aureispira sp.]|nr:hypothetical protein [Aureispira sp.]
MIILGLISIIGIMFCAKVVTTHLIGVAKHYTISESFVGLTFLSIGTSLPEIGTHLAASMGISIGRFDYETTSSIILGANIGSSIIQQTLIAGVVVFMLGTIQFTQKFLQESYTAIMLSTLLTLALAWDGTLTRTDGVVLLLAFLGYIFILYKRQQQGHLHHLPIRDNTVLKYPVIVELAIILISLCCLVVLSIYVLMLTQQAVVSTGLSASLIGVVSLGVITALPSLLVTLQGLKKDATGLALGVLIGSNIVNPLLAIGIGAGISEFYVPLPLIHWDLPIQMITAALLLWWIMFNKRRLGRKGAIFLMALYFAYLFGRVWIFVVD